MENKSNELGDKEIVKRFLAEQMEKAGTTPLPEHKRTDVRPKGDLGIFERVSCPGSGKFPFSVSGNPITSLIENSITAECSDHCGGSFVWSFRTNSWNGETQKGKMYPTK
jgi:hypothetical protein